MYYPIIFWSLLISSLLVIFALLLYSYIQNQINVKINTVLNKKSEEHIGNNSQEKQDINDDKLDEDMNKNDIDLSNHEIETRTDSLKCHWLSDGGGLTCNNDHLPIPLNMFAKSREDIMLRDRAVLDDPLYPPLNRTSITPHDTYRMVGYLVGEESQEDTWQLFGRKMNNNRSEFYVRPTDRTQDLKIPIQEEDMKGMRSHQKLRDLDNLPEEVNLSNPLFRSSNYKVVENPNTNFNSFYY
jgi:hypothetical protein